MATHYSFGNIVDIFKTTAGEFMKNNSFRHAAALSYYTIFSLPAPCSGQRPLLAKCTGR
jgi:membrane protein